MPQKQFITTFCISLVTISFLTACQPKETQTSVSDTQAGTTLSNIKVDNVMLRHSKGDTKIPASPKKVIVFDTALLDSLDLIGVEVAGVPQSGAPFPQTLSKYKDAKYINAGTLQEPDFETISAAAPDLIIGSGRADKAYDELARIAPTIVLSVDQSRFLDSLKERTLTAAKLFDKEQAAQKQIDILDQEIAKTKVKASKAGTALFLMVNGGKISAYGPGSRFGFIFDTLGMQPATIFSDNGNHGNIVSLEYILAMNPDWIFVLDRETAIGESQENIAAKKVLDNSLINKTKAKNNDRIIYLNAPDIYIAGGIRTYQNLVERVNTALSR